MKQKEKNPIPTNKVETPGFFSTEVADARRFYLDLNPPKSRPLVVVCGGLEHCTQDFAINRSDFPFYSIEYVARGQGNVVLGNHSENLAPGSVFSYGPGVSQQISSSPEDGLVKYFVDFTGTRALRLLRSYGLAPGTISRVYPVNSLRTLFEELIEAGSTRRGGEVTLCLRLLECLLLKFSSSHTPGLGAESQSFASYQRCRQHIETHFLRLRSLDETARECFINMAYLCRLFRQFEHISPYQFLLKLKMDHAADLLQKPGTLIKQVAEDCGFDDPFHFSRLFRSAFGVSPNAFRALRPTAAPTSGKSNA